MIADLKHLGSTVRVVSVLTRLTQTHVAAVTRAVHLPVSLVPLCMALHGDGSAAQVVWQRCPCQLLRMRHQLCLRHCDEMYVWREWPLHDDTLSSVSEAVVAPTLRVPAAQVPLQQSVRREAREPQPPDTLPAPPRSADPAALICWTLPSKRRRVPLTVTALTLHTIYREINVLLWVEPRSRRQLALSFAAGGRER